MLDKTLPLDKWNESTVSRYLRDYRGGRIPPSSITSLGLLNGRELQTLLHDPRADDRVREAAREASRDPMNAWTMCERVDDAEALELGTGKLERARDPLLGDVKDEGEEVIDGAFPPLCEVPSLGLAGFVLVVAVGMTLCCTLLAGDLAEYFDMEKGEFVKKFLQYASIPIGTTVFTFVHVWFALWATFYPLEFVGCWQIPGTNVGFPIGWRGIIPHKGDEMARMAVRMIKQHLLTVQEVFARLDPDRMGQVLKPALSKKMEEVVDAVGNEEAPALWGMLPQAVKREIAKQAAVESPGAVKDMLLAMRPEIEQLLDLEHLVVEVLVSDLRLCVDVFVVCGHKELAFIRNAGAFMGGVLGLIQMVVLFYYNPIWFLPTVGALAGALTNYLALLLIFWPLYPIKFCGFTLHGRFLRRQKEVSKAYGKLVHRHVLKVKNIVNELLNGGEKVRVQQIVRASVYKTVDKSLAPVKPFLSLLPGSLALVERVKERACKIIDESMFEIMMSAEDYMDSQLDLEYTLESRMSKLDYPEFESLLHPIFQSEEWKLVLVGAVVGFLFGMLQVLVVRQ